MELSFLKNVKKKFNPNVDGIDPVTKLCYEFYEFFELFSEIKISKLPPHRFYDPKNQFHKRKPKKRVIVFNTPGKVTNFDDTFRPKF